MRTRFGDFAVDLDTRQLFRGTDPVHLTPKAYQLLVLLVEAHPRALSKAELQQGLWPSTIVEEANLSVIVAELRAALDDDARQPWFVRTVHGYGYAFAADVVRDRGRMPRDRLAGQWWFYADGVQVRLEDGEALVGREPPIAVWLNSGSVSRRHARLVVNGESVSVEDLGSKNGTYVNGRQVTSRTELHDGDTVRFGVITLTLRWTLAPMSTETMGPV
jgi:DNA-binding winged helix-turn-helix (wHTH) protein